MSFGIDLEYEFNREVSRYTGKIDEEYLFRSLAKAVCIAAKNNHYGANVLEIHKHPINFEEKSGVPFYYIKDRGQCKSCELADIMFVMYNRAEARLCFMQNKYDRREIWCRGYNFEADTRQLYVLKNRPPYWKGRKHSVGIAPEQILSNARYNTVTNYGIFYYDRWSDYYGMEYYNADAIKHPLATGRKCLVEFDVTYDEFSTIDNPNDQLNYAFWLWKFGDGLENMIIGEKYNNIDGLLRAINIEEVIKHFRDIGDTEIEYDKDKSSALAKVVVIVDLEKDKGIGNG